MTQLTREPFEAGTLRGAILATTDRALEAGALRPIATTTRYANDGGVRFVVRVAESLARKQRDSRTTSTGSRAANPFLPYDPALFVANVSETHVSLLNKFNVMPRHLLVVTRRFVPQETPLDSSDFAALWRCLVEFDSLGFYNSDPTAGASQPHRHLQLIPLPLDPAVPAIPITAAWGDGVLQQGLSLSHRLGFRSRLDLLGIPEDARAEEAAGELRARYDRAIAELGLSRAADRFGSYNLLLARDWMWTIPRTRESFERISLNALPFAGSFFVKEARDARVLARSGPLRALRHVAVGL